MRLWLVPCLLAAILASSCGMFGDPTVDVVFVNETGSQVTVFPDGRSYPASKRTLTPAQSTKVGILASCSHPENVLGHVEAVDSTGALVFCHAYTCGEVQKLDGFIRIRSGALDCR